MSFLRRREVFHRVCFLVVVVVVVGSEIRDLFFLFSSFARWTDLLGSGKCDTITRVEYRSRAFGRERVSEESGLGTT